MVASNPNFTVSLIELKISCAFPPQQTPHAGDVRMRLLNAAAEVRVRFGIGGDIAGDPPLAGGVVVLHQSLVGLAELVH